MCSLLETIYESTRFLYSICFTLSKIFLSLIFKFIFAILPLFPLAENCDHILTNLNPILARILHYI